MSKRAAHEKNSVSNELNPAGNRCHFMLPEQFPVLAGAGADPQADSPAPSVAEPKGSALDPAVSAPALVTNASAPPASSPRAPPVSNSPRLAPRMGGQDISTSGGESPLGPPLAGSSAPATDQPTGSSLVESSAPATDQPTGSSTSLAAPALQRPTTRLQQGIRKPKIYTDGTIRYGQLAATTEGPIDLQHALVDNNWKRAMDVALH